MPETTFAYPWLAKMFHGAKYIIWHRHPYDSLFSEHKSDNLIRWDIDCPIIKNKKIEKAVSWKYQYDLVKSTPKPMNIIQIKYEDFIKDHEKTKAKLEEFLNMKLVVPELRQDSVYKWKNLQHSYKNFKFLDGPMRKLGYSGV